MELTKLMYREKNFDQPPFGLVENNLFSPQSRVISNASWFNKSGELLGQGSLSQKWIKRIVGDIDPNVLFIVVPSGLIASEDSSPGTKLVAEHCRLIINHENVHVVESKTDHPLLARLRKLTIPFREITRAEAVAWLVQGYPPIALL